MGKCHRLCEILSKQSACTSVLALQDQKAQTTGMSHFPFGSELFYSKIPPYIPSAIGPPATAQIHNDCVHHKTLAYTSAVGFGSLAHHNREIRCACSACTRKFEFSGSSEASPNQLHIT